MNVCIAAGLGRDGSAGSRSSPMGVPLSSFWTNRLGGKVTDWQLQWLDSDRAFWKFLPSLFLLGKADSPSRRRVSCIPFLGHLPSPAFFFYTKVECSLCHVCKLQREEQKEHGLFSFFLLPPLSPKRIHSCKEQTDTLELLIPPPPPIFCILFFPSRPPRMDSLSALGN